MENTYNSSENEKAKSFIGNIIFLVALVGATFYFLLKDQNIMELIQTIKGLNVAFIITGFISAFLFICCEAMVFKILLSSFGDKTSYFRILKYSFIGFYFSSITPSASGGQPMQIYYMKKDKINLSISSLTILLTVVVFQINQVCYALFVLLFNYHFVKNIVAPLTPFIAFGFSINIILISFFIVAIFSRRLIKKVVDFSLGFLHKIRIVKDIEKVRKYAEHQISEYRQGAVLIRQNRKILLKVFLVSITQLTLMFSVTFFVYKAFGFSTYSFWDIISLQAILYIAVASLPLPGAVGATEGGFMLLFKSIFPPTALTSAMLVSRGMSYYLLLILSSVVVMIAHIKVKRMKLNTKTI